MEYRDSNREEISNPEKEKDMKYSELLLNYFPISIPIKNFFSLSPLPTEFVFLRTSSINTLQSFIVDNQFHYDDNNPHYEDYMIDEKDKKYFQSANLIENSNNRNETRIYTNEFVYFQLFSTLFHLSSNEKAFEEIVKHNQLLPLSKFLHKTQYLFSFSLNQLLIRTLCSFIEISSQTTHGIEEIKQSNLISFLLSFIKSQTNLIGVPFLLELCQMIIFTIRRSSELSQLLFKEYKSNDGDNILTNCLTWMSEHSLYNEKVSLSF